MVVLRHVRQLRHAVRGDHVRDCAGAALPGGRSDAARLQGRTVSDSSWDTLAERLKARLGLKHDPIAVAFDEHPPAAVAAHRGSSPPAMDSGRTGTVPA